MKIFYYLFFTNSYCNNLNIPRVHGHLLRAQGQLLRLAAVSKWSDVRERRASAQHVPLPVPGRLLRLQLPAPVQPMLNQPVRELRHLPSHQQQSGFHLQLPAWLHGQVL